MSKKPNYGQQTKIKKLLEAGKAEELAAYMAKNGFEVNVDISPEALNRIAPLPAPEVIHEVCLPEEIGSVNTRVILVPPVNLGGVREEDPGLTAEPEIKAEEAPKPVLPIKVAAAAFKRLYDRLEANAAHSVLNWEEVGELSVFLAPYFPTPEELAVEPPKPPPEVLPEGQKWATIVGEPMNRSQKFIKFPEDEATSPWKILHVKADYGFMHPNRMIGRKVRVKLNSDDRVGGWVLV